MFPCRRPYIFTRIPHPFTLYIIKRNVGILEKIAQALLHTNMTMTGRNAAASRAELETQ
jgi:hypothetical protein